MPSNITVIGNLCADCKEFTSEKGEGYTIQIAENYFSVGEKKTHFWTAFFRFLPDGLLPYLTKGQSVMISGQPSISVTTYNGNNRLQMIINNPSTPSLIASGKRNEDNDTSVQHTQYRQHTPPPQSVVNKPTQQAIPDNDYTPF